MKRHALLSAAAILLTAAAANAQLASKITHYDLAKTNTIKAVHDGAGTMNFGPLMTDKTLSTNMIFLHRGVLHAHGGIGQHFHNHCEEMFVIFDGEAEFTINGRTSLLKGTVGAPDRMGSSHAIYNPTDHDVEWMNINVGTSKVYDAFNLGDDRVGAPKDKIPQFVTMQLDRALLKPAPNAGKVQRRRALSPSVFYTPWAYVDHVLIAPGGRYRHRQPARPQRGLLCDVGRRQRDGEWRDRGDQEGRRHSGGCGPEPQLQSRLAHRWN